MTAYLPLLHELDAWQATARAAHPGVIPCRPGCSACCHGPFDIPVADAEQVASAVAALPGAIRQRVLVRAAAQLERMRELAPELAEPWDLSRLPEGTVDELCEALAEEPCPCLEADGRCAVYESRPMVCRVIGLGMVDADGGVLPNACPIQDDFPGYAELPPQPFALSGWEDRADRVAEGAAARLGLPVGYETTVAGAALLPVTATRPPS